MSERKLYKDKELDEDIKKAKENLNILKGVGNLIDKVKNLKEKMR